jgi:hypothetical protein
LHCLYTRTGVANHGRTEVLPNFTDSIVGIGLVHYSYKPGRNYHPCLPYYPRYCKPCKFCKLSYT